MTQPKLLVFIVAYNAQNHIENVLDRIPASVWNKEIANADILILDDSSKDNTTQVAKAYGERTGRKFIAMRNEVNQGYGGNQKIGYQYAIDHGYDTVVLLHGDGQYDPALIPMLAEPALKGEADVVIGSRMINRAGALKGGMPMYKFIGNIVLTTMQNMILGVKLSEFHSGYRIYRTQALKSVPFQLNANYFDFDTDILIQMIDTKQRFKEISVPTFYGDEICHVNGLKYAAKIMLATVFSRLQKMKLCYMRKFDYSGHKENTRVQTLAKQVAKEAMEQEERMAA